MKKMGNEIINEYLSEVIDTEIVKSMKKYMQHGNTSAFEHSVKVVKLCYKIDKKFKLNANLKDLLLGAMLHDFYLYDWHKRSLKYGLHGYNHSRIAMENAIRYFDVNENVQNMILTHMWPLNLTKIPKNKEAWILCLADKICSVEETFRR